MIEAAVFSAASSGLTAAETERLGVYLLAGIVGVVVAGLIACAKSLRNDLVRRD